MQLVSLRVRHYRTVGATEQHLPLDSGLTIVGPNNSGKTNLLRSILLFFSAHEDPASYNLKIDIPFGSSGVKTSMVATFDGDDSGSSSPDAPIYNQLDEIFSLYERQRRDSVFNLSLVFSSSGNPVYQFFPNWKKPADNPIQQTISRRQRQLISDLFRRFSIHYIPSAKSVSEVYDDVLVPFLRTIAAKAIEPQILKLRSDLDVVAKSVTHALNSNGLPGLKVTFDLPVERELMSNFDFNMQDPFNTPIFRKGQGIQSTALLASLQWVADEEDRMGKSAIWLLEEPETYLHPQLTETSRAILENLAKRSLVVTTTHSLAFVPSNPATVVGTELVDQQTIVRRFDSYAQATEILRASLGIRFADFFNLSKFNILVEGKTDRERFSWFLNLINPADYPWVRAREASVLDFGGIRGLGSFLRATYSFIREERASVAVFDGDQAGEKERKDLRSYFGQKNLTFQSNVDFVVNRDRFSLEGLYPDEWILEIDGEHPSWFKEISQDASGKLLPYQIQDNHKSDVLDTLSRRAEAEEDLDWAHRWIDVFNAIENALTLHELRLKNKLSTNSN